ncbi:MAG TPA: sigma-54 dependent transcriptional regulator [Candidatus Eisenbacteria bacterium]
MNAMRSAPTVLIVDDEARVRKSLAAFLADEGYGVLEAGDLAEARAELEKAGDDLSLVLLDVWMPGGDGLDFLENGRDLLAGRPVVVMSGHGNIDMAVRAIRLGAWDFLEKPVTPERLTVTLGRALEMARLRRERDDLRSDVAGGSPLLGSSAVMERLRKQIARVGPSSGKVLILGENGTGKELVARAIHEASPRSERAFVRVNSAAIPRDLIESELFGHEKGAFTGATAARKGKMELADGGTLFLDEIGDMSLEAQAKLLRALENGEIERLGGSRTIVVDVRLIAATNKNLKFEIQSGRFREDLYYRLNVVPIQVPPLREHMDDIPVLVAGFIARGLTGAGRPNFSLSSDAMSRLCDYPWPGNVRELRNAMERLSILAENDVVDAATLVRLLPELTDNGEVSIHTGSDETNLRGAVEQAERRAIKEAIEAAGGNMSEAARRLGIDRANLYRKMKRYQMDKGEGE